MKKIIVLLCLFVGHTLLAGEAHDLATELHYLESYQQGIQTAKKEHKIMMLVVVEDDCHWCKKFKRTTLSHEAVKKDLQNLVKVMLDRYADMPDKLENKFFPMTYFIDPQTQTVLKTSYGYRTKELLIKDIQEARTQLNSSEQ